MQEKKKTVQTKKTVYKVTRQKTFQWPYTPKSQQCGCYQMLLGDYLRQKEKQR